MTPNTPTQQKIYRLARKLKQVNDLLESDRARIEAKRKNIIHSSLKYWEVIVLEKEIGNLASDILGHERKIMTIEKEISELTKKEQ